MEGGGGVARISDFFFLFPSKESASGKNCFPFEGLKVREDWLVQVNLLLQRIQI